MAREIFTKCLLGVRLWVRLTVFDNYQTLQIYQFRYNTIIFITNNKLPHTLVTYFKYVETFMVWNRRSTDDNKFLILLCQYTDE